MAYIGKGVIGVEHPSTSALTATTGTFSGAVGVTGSTTATGGLNVGTIKDVGNNATAMTIDTAGRILQPAKPIFYATAESTISMTTSYAETTAFSNAFVNVGSHYNTGTGRFTAPIAGVYNFGVASLGNATATTYRLRLYKNGSSLNKAELRIQTEGGAYGTNGEFCVVTSLSASDYVSIFVMSDDGTDAYGDSNFRYSYFRGHLMG